MGVPALFRWLANKYPKITSTVVESEQSDLEGNLIEINTADPNPNGEEFDNLYLDMNGIIHPCCHPEDKPAPATEEEMFIEIFKYIDRIFAMIRPRKLLYMAIDGVAPRAKMNQQRSRRFRAAQEAREKEEKKQRIQEEMGIQPDDDEDDGNGHGAFDSNCITPGTPFMANLAENLKFYVAKRLNSDPGWKNVKVILSDASVPSEGEHKIMDFIRRQRTDPNHDTNTSHVLYGLDADLIMLALATHEPHFKILREDVFFNERFKNQTCFVCNQAGHVADECKKKGMGSDSIDKSQAINFAKKPFIFLHVHVLREYLEVEMRVDNSPILFDLEKAIDDWVFLCFFVGNDFLPHLPSLEIKEGAIDSLIQIYKKNFSTFGGYVCEDGFVELEKIELFMSELGLLEDVVFQNRKDRDERRKANIKRRKIENRNAENASEAYNLQRADIFPIRAGNNGFPTPKGPSVSTSNANNDAAAKMRALLSGSSKKRPLEDAADADGNGVAANDSDSSSEPDDEVRLWEGGWKERYYRSKFQVESRDKDFIGKVVGSYVEGLSWVLRYYYQGCPSWNWYYPYHYAPFASDFVSIGKGKLDFDLGEPFAPLEQLMSVLPGASASHIPEGLRSLMLDEESPIIDFYPEDFPLDMNGKKFAWQGVVLLPFIDEKRLLSAVREKYKDLSPEDLKFNDPGDDLIYVGAQNPLYDFLCDLYGNPGEEQASPIDPVQSLGMSGSVLCNPNACLPGTVFPSLLADYADSERDVDLRDIDDNQSISAIFFGPKLREGEIFLAHLKKGARLARRVLDSHDHHLVRTGANQRGRGRRGGRFGGSHGRDSMHMEVSQRMISHYTGGPSSDQRGGGGGANRRPMPYYSQNQGNYNEGPRQYSGGGGHSSNQRSREPYGSNYGSQQPHQYQQQSRPSNYQSQQGPGSRDFRGRHEAQNQFYQNQPYQHQQSYQRPQSYQHQQSYQQPQSYNHYQQQPYQQQQQSYNHYQQQSYQRPDQRPMQYHQPSPYSMAKPPVTQSIPTWGNIARGPANNLNQMYGGQRQQAPAPPQPGGHYAWNRNLSSSRPRPSKK